VSDWGGISRRRLSVGQVIAAIFAVVGTAQVISVFVGGGTSELAPSVQVVVVVFTLVLVVLGIRVVYLSLNFPHGAAWLFALEAILCVVGWFTIAAVPAFVAGLVVAAIVAHRHSGLDLRVNRHVLKPATGLGGSGRAAAVVQLVKDGNPVSRDEISSALQELESLWHEGVIDEDSYRAYGSTLARAADLR
jgi:hypothetical protein